jgi:hypothetical protein
MNVGSEGATSSAVVISAHTVVRRSGTRRVLICNEARLALLQTLTAKGWLTVAYEPEAAEDRWSMWC